MKSTAAILAAAMFVGIVRRLHLRCLAQPLWFRQAVQCPACKNLPLIYLLCVAVEFNAPQPLFGMELRSHLERSSREIASVLEDCVGALLEYGMEEEVR